MKPFVHCFILLFASAAFATITPVQSAATWGATGNCTASFSTNPASNHLLVVWASWTTSAANNITVSSVSDTQLNSFLNAVGPTLQSASNTASQIFYVTQTTGSGTSDTVTVSFSSTPPGLSSNCVIGDVSGADPNYPLDSVSAGYSFTANSAMDSGDVAPANANLLLFGGGTSSAGTAGLGTGFTFVQHNGGSITEYQGVSNNGALQRATAGLSGGPGNWVMQLAAFRDTSATITGGWSPIRAGAIRYADQFPGADIGAKEVAACNDLPAAGGEIYIPAGTYNFSTTMTNCEKNVIIHGAGEGSSQLTTSGLFGTNLVWTGSGGTAILISGGNVMAIVRDLSLDNTGTGAVGVDIEGKVNHVFVEHVTVLPKVDFTTALVQAGVSANVVDVNLDDDYFRRSTPGTVALFETVQGHLVSRQTRYIGGVVQIGDTLGNGPVDVHFIGGSCEPSPTNLLIGQDCFLVNRVQVLKIDHLYGEFGAKPGNIGYWIDVAPGSGNNLAWSLTVSNSWINGGDPYCTPEPCTPTTVYTTYAVNLNFAQADITLANNEWYNFANPAHVVRNQSAAHIYEYGNTVNSSGMDMVDSLGSVTTEINNYSVGLGVLFDDVDEATKQFNGTVRFYSGAIVEAGERLIFVEGSNTGPGVGNDVCDGNSTDHAIECSYNGSSFQKLTINTLEDCGASASCSAAFKGLGFMVRGDVKFPSVNTVTVSSLPFTSSGSYSCTASDLTTAAGVVNATTYTSGASVTFTETGGTNVDEIRYICLGF